MTDSLSKTQRLVLIKLLFTREQPLQSKVRPELKVKERKELADAGLIALEPRARGARAVVLTDRAWEWASENLEAELMVSKYATEALEAVLRQLNRYLSARSLALADLFQISEAARREPDEAVPSVGERIREAYLALSGGQFVRGIRISGLKAALSDVPAAEIDRTLIEMQQRNELSLQIMEDPRQLSEADHAAALRIGGDARHLVYLEK